MMRLSLPWFVHLSILSIPIAALSLAAIALHLAVRPPVPSSAALSSFPAALVEAERQKLAQQAQKDIASPETACYQQSVDCAYSAYQQAALLRLAALKQLQPNLR